MNAGNQPMRLQKIRSDTMILRMRIEGPVFGMPLEILIAKELKLRDMFGSKVKLPLFVEECIAFLCRPEMMASEGLFRQSGRTHHMIEIKALYDQGKHLNLSRYDDPYTIAAVLKLFLREMPEPVIPLNMYSTFIDWQKTLDPKNIDLQPLKDLLKILPYENKVLMKVLMQTMSRVASNSAHNKMDPRNLSIVMGPNLMRSKNPSLASVVQDAPTICQLTCLLITNCAILFNEDEDTEEITLEGLLQQHAALSMYFPLYVNSTYTVEDDEEEDKNSGLWGKFSVWRKSIFEEHQST